MSYFPQAMPASLTCQIESSFRQSSVYNPTRYGIAGAELRIESLNSLTLLPYQLLIVVAQQRTLHLDGYDRTILAVYLAVIIGIPLSGYVFMFLDFKRYLRSLRRALVRVSQAMPVTPYWALRSRPVCLKVLGLELPATEEEVMTAYRELAKEMHPDRGGELDQFLRLQRYFEQALLLVREGNSEN